MSEIQSILFDKSKRSLIDSLEWLISHNITPMKIHETVKFYRFRINDPKKYTHLITKKIPDKGISFIIGFR
jgi:hypothetical protein